MFWNNKKEYAEVDGLPVVLSRREAFIEGFINRTITNRFLAYQQGHKWVGLVNYEEYKEKTDALEKKLDLILNHLNLQYAPETEKKEPAKLVGKVEYLGNYLGVDWIVSAGIPTPPEKPKKKAGRPKKK